MKDIGDADKKAFDVHDNSQKRMPQQPLPLSVFDEHAEEAVAEPKLSTADRIVPPLAAIGVHGLRVVGFFRKQPRQPLVRLIVDQVAFRDGRRSSRREEAAVEIPVLARDKAFVIAANRLQPCARNDAQTVDAGSVVERPFEVTRT